MNEDNYFINYIFFFTTIGILALSNTISGIFKSHWLPYQSEFSQILLPWYRAWHSRNYNWCLWSTCRGCGLPAVNANPSGHLLLSPIFGLAYALIIKVFDFYRVLHISWLNDKHVTIFVIANSLDILHTLINNLWSNLIKHNHKYISLTGVSDIKIHISCKEYARRWAKKEDAEVDTLSE